MHWFTVNPLRRDRSKWVRFFGCSSGVLGRLISFFFPFSGLGGSLNAAAILDFVDSGHDLILAADASASDLIREIATECGVDFDEVSENVSVAYNLIQ